MKLTSQKANKLLRSLNDEFDSLIEKENRSKEFLCSVGESVESVRPDYNYKETQEKLDGIERKIRKLKHSINEFNLNTNVGEFNMTVDEMLVYIPQLTKKKEKLALMKSRLKKERVQDAYRQSSIIDYTYANYDIESCEVDYREVCETLAQAQTALDLVNNTVEFDFDF